MKKIINPYGDKGGRLISDVIRGETISMMPGEERLVSAEVAAAACYAYPFLMEESVIEPEEKEVLQPEYNGEKQKKRKSFLHL